MKRSEINRIIRNGEAFLQEFMWSLPEWARWSPYEWKKYMSECESIFQHGLGWDITDFGSGDYKKRGLFLFTLRNGINGQPGRNYAEKIMIVDELQETPLHFHRLKREDIINRGGGDLVFHMFAAAADGSLDNRDLIIFIDDRRYSVKAGEKVVLEPGQSLCLEPEIYHRFYAAEGTGRVLTGEVSQVNDDKTDNYFFEKVGRFPEIEEDEEPLYLLSSDYKRFLEVAQ